MCDEATRLAKIGRQEYDLIRLHDAPNSDEQTKFECDLELARFQVIRSQIALKNVYNEEFVTPAKLRYLRDDLEAAEEHLKKLLELSH
uniref:Na+/H+ antiporter n=1 Tax=Caenorhabditis tropicalis TaxID=1561998 RepID=A0A1I7TIT8_9PELO